MEDTQLIGRLMSKMDKVTEQVIKLESKVDMLVVKSNKVVDWKELTKGAIIIATAVGAALGVSGG